MGIREEFINKYMVHLKGALPRDLCDEWVRVFFARTGVDESNTSIFPADCCKFSGKTRSIPVAEAASVT